MPKTNTNTDKKSLVASLLGASLLALGASVYGIYRLKKDNEKQVKKFVKDYDRLSDELSRVDMGRNELRDEVRDLRHLLDNERHLTIGELTDKMSNLVLQMEVENEVSEKRQKVKGKILEFVSKMSTK